VGTAPQLDPARQPTGACARVAAAAALVFRLLEPRTMTLLAALALAAIVAAWALLEGRP